MRVNAQTTELRGRELPLKKEFAMSPQGLRFNDPFFTNTSLLAIKVSQVRVTALSCW